MNNNWLKNKNFISFTLSALTFATVTNTNFYLNSNQQNSQIAVAQTANSTSALGTNLNGLAGWSTEFAFLDGFKTSKQWMTTCVNTDPGCNGAYDTNEYHLLNLDKDGWVKSLPKPSDAPRYTRISTLLFRDIPNARYPGGKYVVLYDGEGTIEYGNAATKDVAASKPGKDVINVTPTKGAVAITITKTDPKGTGNYIRNIRVIEAKYESTYATQVFNPTFINKIKKFRTLRFMDWMKTNDSLQQNWSTRPTPNVATYSLKGASVEAMVDLVNRIDAEPWFTMPHMATDDYMKNFAQMVKGRLKPNQKVYVELSNEVWNHQFKQAKYAQAQADAKWGKTGSASWMQWYGMRTAQMCNIWKNVFADQKNRITCVYGTQTVNTWLGKMGLDCPLWVAQGNKPCYQSMDALAITGYFSGGLGEPGNASTVESWMKLPDGGFSKVFAQIEKGGLLGGFKDSLPDAFARFDENLKMAKSKGLGMVVYEGGSHIVGKGAIVNNQKISNYLNEVNRRPEMYGIYQKLLAKWKTSGGTVFMHFNDAGRYDKWGSWGALEHIDQNGSPKYNALMNFMDNNPCWWNSCKK